MSQFSFQIPRPLQENYVRKRSARLSNACDGARVGSSRAAEPAEGKHIAASYPFIGVDF